MNATPIGHQRRTRASAGAGTIERGHPGTAAAVAAEEPETVRTVRVHASAAQARAQVRERGAAEVPPPSPAAQQLLQRVVAEVRRTANGRILADVEIDGIRCVLTRIEPAPEAQGLPLSPRELEIARMIACGHPNKTIAAVLDISSWTVGTYLRRIFLKLGVSSRAAMVARLMGTEGL